MGDHQARDFNGAVRSRKRHGSSRYVSIALKVGRGRVVEEPCYEANGAAANGNAIGVGEQENGASWTNLREEKGKEVWRLHSPDGG